MMDAFEAVRTLLAVRRYQDRPVSEAIVRRIVEAGRVTGSGMNQKPWHFVVVLEQGAGLGAAVQPLAELPAVRGEPAIHLARADSQHLPLHGGPQSQPAPRPGQPQRQQRLEPPRPGEQPVLFGFSEASSPSSGGRTVSADDPGRGHWRPFMTPCRFAASPFHRSSRAGTCAPSVR